MPSDNKPLTPGKARREAIAALRATRRKMITMKWTRGIARENLATRRRAAEAMLNVGAAIDVLEQAELESIANAMEGNERAIKDGIKDVRAAIKSMRNVKAVLSSVEKLLKLGEKIAPLLI